MARFDNERLALEAASGGKNTLILDDMGLPSVMVRIPKFRICDVLEGGSKDWHPAFYVNGKVINHIYISKYHNIVEGDRGYSLPGRDPAAYLSNIQAHEYCRNKGPGWHLMSNAEWAALAMWCKANGHMPHGNNTAGVDYDNRHEWGVQSYEYLRDGEWNNMSYGHNGTYYQFVGRTLTGSGPPSWYHDNSIFGISGLNGNVWDIVSGVRMINGEIQVIPDNNSALCPDETVESTEWRAILTNGTYATPGIANTLKYNSINAGDNTQTNHRIGHVQLATVRDKPAYTGGDVNDYWGYLDGTFETTTAASGLTVPEKAKILGLYPYDSDHGADYISVRNYGERYPLRGGCFDHARNAGVFYLYLYHPRSDLFGSGVGFRAAFVDLESENL